MLSLAILLMSIVFLESEITPVVNASDISTLDITIPFSMKPGTVLIYNENLEPVIIEGGYVENSFMNVKHSSIKKPRLVKITEEMSEEEAKQIELENWIAEDAYLNGIHIQVFEPKIYKGMKVVYDEYTGDINNIYYVDENEPSGYSIHNRPYEKNSYMKDIKKAIESGSSVTWTWGKHNNTLTYQPLDDSFLGTGRATYFTGKYGNRNNILKDRDCATHMDYDFSKVGDKDVSIRNLDTDKKLTFYQADVGALPDAIIDIWGLKNLQDLAGKTGVTSIPNVRYYHKRFSDQSIPN